MLIYCYKWDNNRIHNVINIDIHRFFKHKTCLILFWNNGKLKNIYLMPTSRPGKFSWEFSFSAYCITICICGFDWLMSLSFFSKSDKFPTSMLLTSSAYIGSFWVYQKFRTKCHMRLGFHMSSPFHIFFWLHVWIGKPISMFQICKYF